jgi:hypothetical protein
MTVYLVNIQTGLAQRGSVKKKLPVVIKFNDEKRPPGGQKTKMKH